MIVQNEPTPVGEYRNEVGHRKFDSKKPPTSMDRYNYKVGTREKTSGW